MGAVLWYCRWHRSAKLPATAVLARKVSKSSKMKTSFTKIASFVCLVSVTTPDVAAAPKFRSQDIDDTIKIGYGLVIADVNGDSKADIVLADKSQVVWYQNPSWRKHVITENLTERDHVCVAAQDIDGDGKAEIAVGAGWNPGDTLNSGSVHYLIPPDDRTQMWTPIALPHEPTVHRMHWVKNWQDQWELTVLPLHGRGNKGGKGAGVKLLAYTVPDNPRNRWETRVINDDLHMTHNYDPVQWDNDVATELLIAGREGVFLLNWVDGEIRLKMIGDDQGGGAGEVRKGSLGDNKPFVVSIEPMHGNSVVIYRPKAGEADGSWHRQVIENSLNDGHAVACGDLAGIGRDQVVIGWRAMRGGAPVGIKLFTPNEAGDEWEVSVVDHNTMACEDLKLADLNGDGRLDIIAAGRKTQNVKVYWNEGSE
ncbi:MAG: hypothetical protein M2R45_03273 [Verrucomicrobia subdivision 3 bacterium]|nr:hypothetical protein [Limisphaerales bacterium]MCS1416133.1 hypothetical protein [Limisphaerales bacterium]